MKNTNRDRIFFSFLRFSRADYGEPEVNSHRCTVNGSLCTNSRLVSVTSKATLTRSGITESTFPGFSPTKHLIMQWIKLNSAHEII